MATINQPNFFKSNPYSDLQIRDLSGGLNDSASDLDIQDNELSGGQNMVPDSDTSWKKRGGETLYGNFLGTTTGILGGFNFLNKGGTQEQLAVYDTGVYRLVTSVWTALTSVTMTTNKQADGCYFGATNKFYILNATDSVVKYTSGTSGDQTDASFKKGKYIVEFENRLIVAGVSTQEDTIWYTDLGVDTFGTNNYFKVVGEVTGLLVLNDKLLIFTKRQIWRLDRFIFDGFAHGPEVLSPLITDFGAIYDRTICNVNNRAYFVGQDSVNKAAIYTCDGFTAQPISDYKIKATMRSISTGQLASACAVAVGNDYLVYLADSGQSTNNLGITYQTVEKRFLPVQRKLVNGRADYSCLFASESGGEWSVYAGTQGTGQVYKINANDGLYDELPEERYLTSGSYNVVIGANPAKRAAQSFKLSNYNTTQSINLSKLAVLLKKSSGTTTALTVRIETDNSGAPSGTLVTNGSTTISAFSDTSYIWKTASFSTAPILTGNTTYWLVIQHSTEGSGDSIYNWLADSCTSSYTNGTLATYQSSAWNADATSDANFVLYPQSAIDGYIQTKAFLINSGLEYQLHRFQSVFSTVGSYFAEVGFSAGEFATFTTYYIDLSGESSNTWGGGGIWGGGIVWGGSQARNYDWGEVNGFEGRTLKMQVRNRNANEQINFNRILLAITKRYRQF